MENRIPLVVIHDISETDAVCKRLLEKGLHTAEITFRTACAREAIAYAVKKYPQMEIGAGTVINEEQCRQAIEAGAKFIVSPGLGKDIAKVCRKHDVPYYPGCVTPTEIMKALGLGLTVLKFFPASVYGGIKALKALSGPFPQVKWIPTGGVNADNEAEYLALSNVFAVGGSYLTE